MIKIYLTLMFALMINATSYSQLLNGSLETWVNNPWGSMDPEFWGTSNSGPVTCSQYQPAQSGTYAAKINSDTIAGNIIPGILSQFFTCTQSPASIDGFYLGDFALNDQLVVTAYIYSDSTEVASGFFFAGTDIGSYTPFSIPLTYSSSLSPDSAILYFTYQASSLADLSGYVVIDNVTLSGSIGTPETNATENISFYPNPATDLLNISHELNPGQDFSIEIRDVKGRLVSEPNFINTTSAEPIRLNTGHLADGNYFFQLKCDEKIITRRFNVIR